MKKGFVSTSTFEQIENEVFLLAFCLSKEIRNLIERILNWKFQVFQFLHFLSFRRKKNMIFWLLTRRRWWKKHNFFKTSIIEDYLFGSDDIIANQMQLSQKMKCCVMRNIIVLQPNPEDDGNMKKNNVTNKNLSRTHTHAHAKLQSNINLFN